ncbi:MAG TPA: PKD domain-containing protein [Planctomycetota bacterium]|nr:PKD domain-containing protein [Planctomycetota bacterium]
MAGAKLCFVEIVPVNTAPTIVSPASATPAPVAVGAEVSFSASAIDEESASLTYTWDFGDGTTVNGQKSSVTHKFMTTGTYDVKVLVNGKFGSTQIEVKNRRSRKAERFSYGASPP